MYLTRRSKIILLAAPAVLMVCVLLGQLALQSMGVAALELADVNLKALGNFSLDPDAGRTKDIPRRWRDLDGQRVSVRGFMLNPRQLGTGSCLSLHSSCLRNGIIAGSYTGARWRDCARSADTTCARARGAVPNAERRYELGLWYR